MTVQPRLAIGALGIVMLAVLLSLPAPQVSREPSGPADAAAFIIERIRHCTTEPRASCYRDLAEELVGRYDLPAIGAAMAEAERDPAAFQKCHETMHYVGQAAYRKNPQVGAVLSSGSPVCFAGFYHGALEAHLIEIGASGASPEGIQRLRSKIPALCRDLGRVSKDYRECLHGLGHALMFVTDGELPITLAFCDQLAVVADREWCYSGAFMENSTSSTNPDHPSRYLRSSDPSYPCPELEERYRSTCFILQTFYAAELFAYDWGKTAEFCRRIPEAYRMQCFHAIGQIAVGSGEDPRLMKQICESFSGSAERASCRQGVLAAIGERYEDPFPRMENFCREFAGTEREACQSSAHHILSSLE